MSRRPVVATLPILAILFYFYAALGIALAAQTSAPPGQGPAADAEQLVNRARQAGIQFGTTNDRKSRDAARKDLDDAERLVRAEVKRDPSCEKCVEVQAGIHLFRSFFKIATEYDECIEVTGKGLERFPQNARLAYMKGYAHYSKNEAGEAVAALNRFVLLAPNDPQVPALKELITESQQKFLSSWYGHANFYQSNDSRITSYNPKAFKQDVVFQFTPESELQLGQQGFAALSKDAPAANDPEAVAFLQQLVGRIIEKTPGPGFKYQVSVLDSNNVNAVTPPGYIIVYTGLLRFVETEAQLAGVIAHELAHNYGHHPARRVIKAYQAQQVKGALTRALGPQAGAAQMVTQIATQTGVDLFLNAYSRFEEKEADLYGAHLMFNAGYNPTSLPTLFLKMYEANPKQPVKFLSTHPPQPDRINYLSDYLQSFPLDRELVVDSSEAFKRIKERYPFIGAAPAAPTTPSSILGLPNLPKIPGVPGLPGGSPR